MIPYIYAESNELINPRVGFYLERDQSTGNIHLMAIDSRGDEWYILQITGDGLMLMGDIERGDISVTEDGYITICKENGK